MSGAQTSTFSNQLYDPLMASRQTSAENQLLLQQQDISGHQIEMGARLASTLLDPTAYPTTEARAAAYPGLVARARAQFPGYFTNAPDTYPGDAATQVLARMGTPSADLFKYGLDRTAKGAIAPGDDGTTATGGTGGGGGGTGTVGGADTAPINAAGDSRTRKAAEGGPPAAGSPGAAVAQQVHDFWRSKGFSEEQTAGIMAGGPGSESDFTPTAGGDKVNGVPTSIGLYQHHGPRLHNAQGTGMLDRYGPNPTADQQNEYAYWEITQGSLKNVGEMLKNAKTPAEAAAIWTQYFGVPADKSEIGRRAAGAQRFVGLYGQPQQGGPGGATAAAPSPGVQMGGDVPPPPGGAPGAYPAQGAGMGAVVGGGVRPNIGGPQLTVAPPPVIRAQPIPAGGTASNADVIMGGVQQAQATPLAGTQVAGPPMVASTQPTAAVPTPPVETPTPARYAGTAPAPSVEAAPQPGWGSQVGSGYGPQNTLAPPPPQPTARPATPAVAPAAQQPPAADALPPLPAPTPPAPTNRNGLTAFQQQDIERRRGMTNVSADELQKRVDSYVAANAAVAEKYQQDEIAYVREARERQTSAGAAAHQTLEEQRQAALDKAAAAEREYQHTKDAETQRLALETAARERAKAVDLTLQGGDDGSAGYAAAYATKAAPIRNPDGSVVYPNMMAYDKPTYRGGKGQVADASSAPDYGEQRVTPPTILSVDQAKAATYADRMLESHNVMNQLDAAATSWAEARQAKAGDFIGYTTASPDYQKLRAAQDNFITAKLRPESGAVINPSEFENDRRTFFPQPGDDLATIALKRKFRETTIAGVAREAGPAYKPPAGGTGDASTPTRVIRYDHTGNRIKE